MERVSEVLQLPVVIEGSGSLALECQPLKELGFLLGRCAAEGGVLQECPEPWLLGEGWCGFSLSEFESLHVAGDHLPVEDDLQVERLEVDVPGFDQRIQKRDAAFDRRSEEHTSELQSQSNIVC